MLEYCLTPGLICGNLINLGFAFIRGQTWTSRNLLDVRFQTKYKTSYWLMIFFRNQRHLCHLHSSSPFLFSLWLHLCGQNQNKKAKPSSLSFSPCADCVLNLNVQYASGFKSSRSRLPLPTCGHWLFTWLSSEKCFATGDQNHFGANSWLFTHPLQ